MALVRVVDYLANPGGGCRFVAEMLRAFREVTDARFEVVSHGPGFERYRRLLDPAIPVMDQPPSNARRAFPPWSSVRGAAVAQALLGLPDFHFDVPPAALQACDVVWFPWSHRHRLPSRPDARAIATFHDCISLEFPGVLRERFRRDEIETTRRWLTSSTARLVLTSNATAAAIGRLFPEFKGSPSVVPLSSKHDPPPSDGPATWPFSGGRYLLCPVNISPHKNLETLLEGFADWGAKVPLVITGPGTDLRNRFNPRERLLRRVISRRGLVQGRDVFTMGYVTDREYYSILDRAWALAMPTLAEGGGSFPVLEAIERGIPVVSSDVPVMREMAERWNARLIWFDARSRSATADTLSLLERDYEDLRRAAAAQVPLLLQRSWQQVAFEYASVMNIADPKRPSA